MSESPSPMPDISSEAGRKRAAAVDEDRSPQKRLKTELASRSGLAQSVDVGMLEELVEQLRLASNPRLADDLSSTVQQAQNFLMGRMAVERRQKAFEAAEKAEEEFKLAEEKKDKARAVHAHMTRKCQRLHKFRATFPNRSLVEFEDYSSDEEGFADPNSYSRQMAVKLKHVSK